MTIRTKYQPPANALELYERLIPDYGGFADGYSYLDCLFNSKFNGSLILRGPPGIGKKSLVSKAAKNNQLNTIVLNPYLQTDDVAAIRKIAGQLKVENCSSMQDLLDNVSTMLDKSDTKVVIVLNNLEEFCRDKQALLYNLTNLVQHGKNICVVGITINLTCLDGLEKRVRSRLSAMSYDLRPPYSSVNGYIEFASLLLGGYEFENDFKHQLAFIYNLGHRSITALKQYLISVCQWTKNNEIIIDYKTPEDRNQLNPHNRGFYFKERFGNLTKNEQYLCAMACYYCTENDRCDFKLKLVEEFVKRHNQPKFRVTDEIYLKAAVVLSECRFFCPVDKSNSRSPVSEMTRFCLGFTAYELRQINLKETIKLNLVWSKL